MKELNSLQITEEEKDALKEYCGWRYTYINLLTSGSMEAIDNLDNISLNTFSKEHFAEAMKIIKNVYSAMCKYSYGKDSRNISLYRGTTESELDYIERNNDECDKLLSTSLKEAVAKQHAGDKYISGNQTPSKNVVLRLKIKSKDLPYINVNNVLGDETNFMEEEEVVLSPFCYLKNVKHDSSWNGIEYYSSDIEQPELGKVDNQNELENQIGDEIANIPNLVKEYLDNIALNNRYESTKSMKKYQETEKVRQEALTKAKMALDKFNSLRDKIIAFTKNMCAKTRDKIYENARNEQDQDITFNLEDIKTKQKEALNRRIQRVDACVKAMDQNSKYEILAKKLDLNWNTGISKKQIDEKFSEYIQKCSKMVEGIDEIGTTSSMQKKEQVDALMKTKQKLDSMKKFIKIMESQVSFFSEENCNKHLKILLNQKVDDLIMQAQLHDITSKLDDLSKTRISIFDRINGKAKELELKKEQLSLNRQLIELSNYKDDSVYSVEEITSKIFAYGRENKGNLTPELSDMISRINNTFPLDATKLQQLVNERTEQKGLIPLKSAQLSRRKSNAMLQEINESIRKEIEFQNNSESVKYRNSKKITTQVTDVPQMLYESLRKTIEATEDRDYAQDMWRMMAEQ